MPDSGSLETLPTPVRKGDLRLNLILIGLLAAATLFYAVQTFRDRLPHRWVETYQVNANDKDALVRKADELLEKSRYTEAAEHYSRALTLGAQPADKIMISRATAYFFAGEVFKSLSDLKLVLRADSTNQEALYKLGTMYASRGNYSKATETFTRLEKLDPAGQFAGDAREQVNIITLTQALERDSLNVDAYLNRGKGYLALGLAEEALKEFLKVLELDPGNVGGLYYTGEVLERSGRVAQAAQMYQKVIELAPQSEMGTAARKRIAEMNRVTSQEPGATAAPQPR